MNLFPCCNSVRCLLMSAALGVSVAHAESLKIASVSSDRILFEETLPGGAMWSYALKRHHTLRLTAIEEATNAGVILYNYDHTLERLNLPDSLKAQHTAKLTAGNVLYSDMGRVLCSISADTCGWHDPLAGHSTAKMVTSKYGSVQLSAGTQRLSQKRQEPIFDRTRKMGPGEGRSCCERQFLQQSRGG
jgi:uncharacterized protein